MPGKDDGVKGLFDCPFCTQRFWTLGRLRYHKETRHVFADGEHVKLSSGATMVVGAAPKVGTKLHPERMAETLGSLREPWDADEMRRLARCVIDDGTHGQPATALAGYVLDLLEDGR